MSKSKNVLYIKFKDSASRNVQIKSKQIQIIYIGKWYLYLGSLVILIRMNGVKEKEMQ